MAPHEVELDPHSWIARLVARLDATGIAWASSRVGCTLEEIAALERTMGVRLPRTYREFLTVCGKSCGTILVGSDFYFPSCVKNTAVANELIAELIQMDDDDEEHRWRDVPRLPPDAVVFFVHQGYIFRYFLCREEDDPRVFAFSDGHSTIECTTYTFSTWMCDVVETAIARRRLGMDVE